MPPKHGTIKWMNGEPKSNSKGRRIGLFIITLVLAGFFLYLAVRRVNWEETLQTLKSANLAYLAAALGVFSVSCLARALRWRVLLSAEKKLPVLVVFWSMMAGYLGNAYLPARAGEVIRSVLVGQRGGISKSFALATALTERLADAVLLVSVSAAALLTITSLPAAFLRAIRVMAVVGFIGAAAIFIAPRMSGMIQQVVHRLPIPESPRNKINGIVSSFLSGAGALQHPTRLFQFLVFSAILWSLDTLVGLLTAWAFGLNPTPSQIFILLAALGIASAIPSTPGYVGVYQFVAITVLVPFGFTDSQALAFIVAFQGLTYLGITFWGLLGLWGPGTRREEKPAAAQ